MPSLGERLRRERLKQGLDISQVASRTRIGSRYLEAIENDDAGSLPGKFFYRSFVRQYASALGLDEKDFDDELRQAAAPVETEPVPAVPPPLIQVPRIETGGPARPNRLPGALIVLLAVILACAGLFGLWQRAKSPKAPAAPPPETAATAVVPAPVVSAADSPAPVEDATEAAPATPTAAPESVVAEPQQPAASTAEPAAAPPPPSAATLGAGPLTVEVTAKDPVWVNISSDGRSVVTRVLQPGDSRTVRGTEEIKVLSGNAGGMSVLVNGRPLEEVGPRGQVRLITVTAGGTEVSAPRRAEPAQPMAPEQ